MVSKSLADGLFRCSYRLEPYPCRTTKRTNLQAMHLLGIHAGSRASCDKAASIHELAQLAVAHVTQRIHGFIPWNALLCGY